MIGYLHYNTLIRTQVIPGPASKGHLSSPLRPPKQESRSVRRPHRPEKQPTDDLNDRSSTTAKTFCARSSIRPDPNGRCSTPRLFIKQYKSASHIPLVTPTTHPWSFGVVGRRVRVFRCGLLRVRPACIASPFAPLGLSSVQLGPTQHVALTPTHGRSHLKRDLA